MDFLHKAQDILLRPKETWQFIKAEEVTIAALYKSYVLVMAAIPVLAQTIGLSLVGTSFIGIRYRASFASLLGEAILSYCVSLTALYIIALLVNVLAPKFGSQKNLTNAFKLVTYSWTASWIAGVLLLIPSFVWFAKLLSLYGFYLFFVGMPVLMDTPRDRLNMYFLCAIVLSAILVGFIYSVVALFFPLSSLI